MALQCIVFDCDGVILDSVPVKTRAFARIAAPHGQEAQDRFVMYHTRHGGVSRYKKFQWFYNEVLGREISDEESERLGRLFAEYALDEVRRCPLIPGIQEVLDTWKGKLPLYVCSGAPHEEVQAVLRSDALGPFLHAMYGNQPARWDAQLQGAQRWRAIVNALTRLRFCAPDGTMDFDSTESATQAPPGLLPWFDVPGRRSSDTLIAFGHWSTLGWLSRPDVLALDTGCVWGGCLSAVRFGATLAEREQLSVRCPQAQVPG